MPSSGELSCDEHEVRSIRPGVADMALFRCRGTSPANTRTSYAEQVQEHGGRRLLPKPERLHPDQGFTHPNFGGTIVLIFDPSCWRLSVLSFDQLFMVNIPEV